MIPGVTHLSPRRSLAIYLAGKIRKHCWRHTIVRDLRGALDCLPSCGAGAELPPTWPILRGAVLDHHDYVGPYFLSCDHGCGHGDDSHGSAAQEPDYSASKHGEIRAAPRVVALCQAALHRADIVFAWIDEADCYGTVAEVGYAKALGKTVWIAGPRRFRDLWFVYELADRCRIAAPGNAPFLPGPVLASWLGPYASPVAAATDVAFLARRW
jgi:hypothetical protein